VCTDLLISVCIVSDFFVVVVVVDEEKLWASARSPALFLVPLLQCRDKHLCSPSAKSTFAMFFPKFGELPPAFPASQRALLLSGMKSSAGTQSQQQSCELKQPFCCSAVKYGLTEVSVMLFCTGQL